MENPKHLLAELPQEIISEILSRLPLKCVGTSRCVSKGWNSLLTSQQFVKTHLARIAPFLPEKLLFLGPRAFFTVTTLGSTLILGGVLVKFDEDLIEFHEEFSQFCGSCDGLVLVLGDKHSKFLINPTTRKIRKLPVSPFALNPNPSYCLHGFGYDSSSDDYKIVTLSHLANFIDVYSLKLNSWKRRGTSPYNHYSKSWATASGVLLNGALHWLASKPSSSFIAAFNLASENFEEISLPTCLDTETLNCSKLMLIKGCLGIVDDLSNTNTVGVFIMNVYGSPDSWTKIVVNLQGAYWEKAICYWNDMLFLSADDDVEDEPDFLTYLFQKQYWGYLVNAQYDDGWNENGPFDDGQTFYESLVSPHFNAT